MSLLLGAFMLLVTVLFVRFWSEQGEKQSANRNVFFSNLSIVGGMPSFGNLWTRPDGVCDMIQRWPSWRARGVDCCRESSPSMWTAGRPGLRDTAEHEGW